MEFKPKRITQHLSSPKAAVRCTHAYRSKRYVLLTGQPDSIVVLKAGCPIVALNDDEMVVSKDGEPVNPTGRFYITADTIDPYHYLFDIFLRTPFRWKEDGPMGGQATRKKICRMYHACKSCPKNIATYGVCKDGFQNFYCRRTKKPKCPVVIAT